MCENCGCSDGANATLVDLRTGKALDAGEHHHHHDHVHAHTDAHAHGHYHGHDHDRDDHIQRQRDESIHDRNHNGPARPSTVSLEQAVLAKNDALAGRNRAWFAGREILALNLVSAPGAGKTTLLERTLRELRQAHAFFVIEGDQATTNDGRRIDATGAPVVQINTGSGCHLDAVMVARAVAELKPSLGSVLVVENVGNLVCPALFDLGEHAKVAMLSVTDGEDKPIKYPHMFRAASLLIINKIDLLPHVRFDLDRCKAYARQVNPAIEILTLSATSGEGLDGWYDWISAAAHGIAAEAFLQPGQGLS
jgi:hydrogenase nickel incorporation protein HypB